MGAGMVAKPGVKRTSKLLVTSFQTWLPHQSENSSDALLGYAASQLALPKTCILLRNLPVDLMAAFQGVRQAVERDRPRAVVACGMAEARSQLTVEQFARRDGVALETGLPLPKLIEGLPQTEISQDAGNFVCNGLYFDLLASVAKADNPGNEVEPAVIEAAVFVHVPILTPTNRDAIAADFQELLRRLNQFLNG